MASPMTKVMTPRRVLSLIFLGVAVSSCGYSMRRSDELIESLNKGVPEEQKTSEARVYVPVVDNLTTKSALEPIVSNAIRNTLSTVAGIKLVNRASDANLVLVATIQSYERKAGLTPVTGTSESEAAGGIAKALGVAGDAKVTLKLSAKMLEQNRGLDGVRRMIWDRPFGADATYQLATRYTESEGSSSAPNINEAREMLQVKTVAEIIAQQIVDQVLQDF